MGLTKKRVGILNTKIGENIWEIIIVIISTFIGVICSLSKTLSWDRSLALSLLFIILGLLIRYKFMLENKTKDIYESIKDGLSPLSSEIQFLFNLSNKDNESFILDDANKNTILDLDLRDTSYESDESKIVLKNLKLWSQKLFNENVSVETKDLWRIIFNVYMNEENKDLRNGKIATNIEIYTNLMNSNIKYFVEKYGEKAVIFIVTSLLPSEWYENKNWIGQEFTFVANYRNVIKKYIKTKKSKGINLKYFNRYIVLENSQDGSTFKSKEDLDNDINYYEKYLKDLHFEVSQAKYFYKTIFRNFSNNYRDILIFGNKEGENIRYHWAIQSTMVPSFPVMFISFYDAQTLAAKCFAEADIYNFTDTIENNSHPINNNRSKNGSINN